MIGDHPRSRGVYVDIVTQVGAVAGSSPLARGLPGRVQEHAAARRIIPARAGFTCLCFVRTFVRRDHPRSRGVYQRNLRRPHRGHGSSPLARGLRRADRRRGDRPRIIPARAGFTLPRALMVVTKADHPRSRGVYPMDGESDGATIGSIPARAGFTPDRCADGGLLGIIPARAGFTQVGRRQAGQLQDHPRSRGVYLRHLLPEHPVSGSSPLARGLLPVGRGPHPGLRIIPARAGFTLRRPSS